MKRLKLFFAACLVLVAAANVNAQNIQVHYDFGRAFYNDLSNRSILTTTVEKFHPDAWGSTFFFVDMDYTSKGISTAYWEIAREEIDQMNILKSSFVAMHRAVDALSVRPQHLLIDGNRFIPYPDIPHTTVVKGDAKFMSIAAASVLAKTYRDDYMMNIHKEYPIYAWDKNKGYPTKAHRAAIVQFGASPYHRKSFNLLGDSQLEIPFE